MAVVKKEKKWVYDYMNLIYKAGAQRTCYMNTIHPIETHDIGSVDDRTGCVVGGEAVDEDFNWHILPPKNPRKRGRPPSTRKESQSQGKHVKRFSKCGDVGHYKNTYRNPRAKFDADSEGDVVAVEDLLGRNYPHCS